MYDKIKTGSIAVAALAILSLAVWKAIPAGNDNPGQPTADQQPSSTSALTPGSVNVDNATAPTQEDENLKLPKTSLFFSETMHDFGEITDGDQVRHTFKFKNTGSNPLVISNAAAGCGCTVPSWPKEPISPGAEGEIVVAYNSSNKVGFKTVTITVTANTDPLETVLKIQANVLEKPGEKKGKEG